MLRLTTGRPEGENDRVVAEAFTFKHGCTFFCGFRSRMHPGARPGRLNEGTTFGICCVVGEDCPSPAGCRRPNLVAEGVIAITSGRHAAFGIAFEPPRIMMQSSLV